MKQIFGKIILIVAIFTFASCSKKKEIDVWTDEDKSAIENLINNPVGKNAYCEVGEREKGGLYTLIYTDAENKTESKTLAPVVAFFASNKEALNKYTDFARADFEHIKLGYYVSKEATIFSFHEKGNAENILTIIFSSDQAKTWTTSHIKIIPEFLSDGKNILHYVFCPNGSTTGYLVMTCQENDKINQNFETKKGALVYRTQDLGVSWEQIGNLPEEYIMMGAPFIQGSTVTLPSWWKQKYFCLFKSDDCINWKEIDLPIDTEEYNSGNCTETRFNKNYGFVKAALFNQTLNNFYFATKDDGNTWILWE